MQEVKQIELVFENCEDMTFLPKQIGAFWCSDITAQVGRIACNSISKQLWCKELFLELYPVANQKYDSFGHKSEDTTFERICRFDDITGIEITYEDGSKDYILLPWNEEGNYTNKHQSSQIDENGRLYVLVSKERDIKSVLSDREDAA